LDTMPLENTEKELEIGSVQTPIKWAIFLVERFNVFERWMNGATVFDPTAGEGNLLEALIQYGIKQGYKLSDMPITNLYGNELNRTLYRRLVNKFYQKYGIDVSPQVTNEDILDLPPYTYDIIIGNPPWVTFADLPENYKEKIKKYIFTYQMAKKPNELLLGKSRMNIAALIIRVSIRNHLKIGGEAIFFMPLSLLLGEESSTSFRSYNIGGVSYAPISVYDFGELKVFEGIATRYGICNFKKGVSPQFPIPYFTYKENKWAKEFARPIGKLSDPLYVGNKDIRLPRIVVSPASKPRQGVNTCGANEVFIFEEVKQVDDLYVRATNKKCKEVLLPSQYLFPLLTKEQFSVSTTLEPKRWILLPYHRTGMPLSWHEICEYPTLRTYLESHCALLQARKGLLIRSFIQKGYWWALLGIGPYSFAPYKVVWEAFGKATFRPLIVEGIWQANQALHAYIPAYTLSEAQYIADELSKEEVVSYLLATRMAGTKSWAQPARVERLLHYEEKGSLFQIEPILDSSEIMP